MGFLLTAMLIWGAMHAYVWARTWAYAGLPVRWALGLGAAMLLLMVLPVAGMIIYRGGHHVSGRLVSVVGMTWAGAFFLLFSVSVLHDAYNVVLSLAGLAIPAARSLRLTGGWPIAVGAVLVALAALYGMVEARWVRAQHVQVPTTKLPAGVDRLRIVQIADIHLGPTVGRGSLERILRIVREAGPDVLVSTGDLLDAARADGDELTAMLASVSAPLGKYAVTGNHEYYADLDYALRFTQAAGFDVLSNEVRPLLPGVSVAGFDDETARHWHGGEQWDEAQVLREAPPGDFVLVLKHRPLVNRDSVPLMDLQLSGHTHRGQIFPFTLFVIAHYEYAHGLVEVGPGTHLYTSRGSGVWGPPMRFLNPPEVTVIDLVRAPE